MKQKLHLLGCLLGIAQSLLVSCDRPSPPASAPVPGSAADTTAVSHNAEGYHEAMTCEIIYGWAWDSTKPDEPVSVDVYAGDKLLGTIAADQYREDLKAANKGNGKHAFAFPVPADLKDGKTYPITMKISNSETVFFGSPKMLTCAPPTEAPAVTASETPTPSP